MVYNMLSQTHEMGDIPIAQHQTCLKTRNKIIYGPQMAVNLFQQEPVNGSHSRDVVKRKLCHNDIVNEQHSNSNVKNKNKLATLSVDMPEQSTMLYPPTTVLKALDKQAHCIDNEQDAEVQEAPHAAIHS